MKLQRNVQVGVALICAAALKLYYSSVSVNGLRWILAPTTWLVELITGARFQFETYAGYMSSDRTFVIAASCAGVNFLITAFLLLSLGRLWHSRDGVSAPASRVISSLRTMKRWAVIPAAGLIAYVATMFANTMRISAAFAHRGEQVGWLSSSEVHRFEGILIYFGFLLLLYTLDQKRTSRNFMSSRKVAIRQYTFPLSVYYVTTLGIPLANGAYRQTSEFWLHSLFVFVLPLFLIATITALRICIRAAAEVRSNRLMGSLTARSDEDVSETGAREAADSWSANVTRDIFRHSRDRLYSCGEIVPVDNQKLP